MVTTDGSKAGVHFFNEETYVAGPADCKPVSNRKDFDFPYVTKLPQQDRMDLTDQQKCSLLFVDPGKKNILTIGTGSKGGSVIKYTMVQRRHESCFKRNQDEYNASISRVVQDNDGNALIFVQNTDQGDLTHMVTLETLITMGYGYAQDYTGSHSSFNLDRFRAYLVERNRWKHVLSAFFQNQQHRRRRYRAQLGVRSSESKLASNIRSKFKDGDCELALCWGNWGRYPNINNQEHRHQELDSNAS
ncbi:hypothetical protein HDU81_005949 [Chytriomyces hyalinus]|nr:hypothetical protein HDU81_005949 [Chytriomyces hyalinus]